MGEHDKFPRLVDMLPFCLEIVRIFNNDVFNRDIGYLSSIIDRFSEERAPKLPLLQEITFCWTIDIPDPLNYNVATEAEKRNNSSS